MANRERGSRRRVRTGLWRNPLLFSTTSCSALSPPLPPGIRHGSGALHPKSRGKKCRVLTGQNPAEVSRVVDARQASSGNHQRELKQHPVKFTTAAITGGNIETHDRHQLEDHENLTRGDNPYQVAGLRSSRTKHLDKYLKNKKKKDFGYISLIFNMQPPVEFLFWQLQQY